MIETKEDAARYEPHAEGRRPEIGARLILDPCVQIPWPDTRATPERPCPRVELKVDNLVAGSTVVAMLNPRTRATAPEVLRSGSEFMGYDPDEHYRLVNRVLRAIDSSVVADHDERQRQKSQADAKARSKRRG